jgi:beta-lactam-binding protein with PASTA domain
MTSLRDGGAAASERRRGVEGLTGIGKGSKEGAARRRHQLEVALGLAALCVVAVIVCVMVAQTRSVEGLIDVVGWNGERAQTYLEEQGFTVTVNTVQSDETAGIVLSQDPAAGTRVQEGMHITLEVAQGRTMPDVVGMTVEEAEKACVEAGIAYELDDVYSDDATPDTVLVQTIAPGNSVTGDTKVTLSVARERKVPDLAGMTSEQAREALLALGLRLKLNEVSQVSGVPVGQVIKTTPAAGTVVEKGATVTANIATLNGTSLQNAAAAVIKAVYGTDPANDAVGTALLPLLSASSAYANSSAHDVWYGLVKQGGNLHPNVSETIQALQRSLAGTPTYEIDSGTRTVVAKVPVLWTWDRYGEGYEGVTSQDIHTVTMTFDEAGGLLTFDDPQTDVPTYEISND